MQVLPMPRKSKPKVIDLFAGAGGLSLGASRAGFNVAAAVEIDKHAVLAHKLNFPNSVHIDTDVLSLSGRELLAKAGLKTGELSGLVGGPPCQGFSSMGRRIVDDPRNSLFSAFFHLVAELKPAFFLAENVPGILAERNEPLRTEALARIPRGYRLLKPIKVRASDFGAPTIRTRVFFIGYDPKRVNELSESDFEPSESPLDVRVSHALKGVPSLGPTWESGDGWKKVNLPDETAFGDRLNGHIPAGVGHLDSLRKLEKRLVSGFFSTTHTTETIQRFGALGAGEVDRVSKSVRLNPHGYCPTLRAGTGPERGSYQAVRPVHPFDPRVICPREAARLQGFPDWFQFDPTKWHSFRQIGNSVSPIVAEAVLSKIFSALK
ncbi:MAG: DNA cytosine methyltransferase [Limisphaerales bacterium]